jgi:hypothetical protein
VDPFRFSEGMGLRGDSDMKDLMALISSQVDIAMWFKANLRPTGR